MYRLGDHDTSMQPPCVIVTDGERRLIQASPGARDMLAACQCIRLVHGVLCAETNADGARLAAAFRLVGTGIEAEQIVTLGEGDATIDITLVMIEAADGSRQIVATVRRMAQSRAAQLRQAIRQFGLTPAEARLLDILCAGMSVPEAAARLGVARTTARTHLQRIFDKSGARRQSDLQRLVFEGAIAA